MDPEILNNGCLLQVDECDAPIETKLIAAGDYLSRVFF